MNEKKINIMTCPITRKSPFHLRNITDLPDELLVAEIFSRLSIQNLRSFEKVFSSSQRVKECVTQALYMRAIRVFKIDQSYNFVIEEYLEVIERVRRCISGDPEVFFPMMPQLSPNQVFQLLSNPEFYDSRYRSIGLTAALPHLPELTLDRANCNLRDIVILQPFEPDFAVDCIGPLKMAISKWDVKVVSYLLDTYHPDIHSPDISQSFFSSVLRDNPSHTVIEDNRVAIVNALIRAGANINVEDFKDSPLHLAVTYNYPKVVQTLIDAGANIEARDQICSTPLHEATAKGHLDIMKMLIKANANIEAENQLHETPLHLAARFGHLDAAQMLIDNKARIERSAERRNRWFYDEPLHQAAANNHSEIVRILIIQGSNVNATNYPYHNTPLHHAAENGHFQMVKILLQAGANVQAQNIFGQTPLQKGVANGCQELIDVLTQAASKVTM